MSIYREILGEAFEQLHPKLQQRYAGPVFKGQGTMAYIGGRPAFLRPLFSLGTRWKFLFPEQGKNIPFQIINTNVLGPHEERQVYWERSFFFPNKTRYFHALMSLDSKKGIVKDYLGDPSLFYSDLLFRVTEDGEMHIQSDAQRFLLGTLEIPLPKMLRGNVLVKEAYVEKREVYSIHVLITNPLFGKLFEYKGEFQANEI